MASRPKDFQGMIVELFAQYGITQYSFERRSKHPCVAFSVAGQSRFFTYAGSPSDVRSVLNHRRTFKRSLREMGVEPRA